MKRFFSLDREEMGLPPPASNNNAPRGPPYYSQSNPNPQPAPDPEYNPDRERERLNRVYNVQLHSLVPADNKLLIFRSLTGIDHVPVLSKDGFFQPRNVPNLGIYTRVVKAEQTAALRYRCFSILINTCLGVQIVVAAALTAIGAAQGPHGVITAFGAINTIMAGILTYLRGSGLPNREKTIEKSWGQVREYIEQREREFCLEGCQLSVDEEVRTIERMYEEVRIQMESGSSEAGGSRGFDSLRNIKHKENVLPMGITKEITQHHADAARAAVGAQSDRVEGSVRDRLSQYGDQYRHTTDDVRHAGENVRHQGESRFGQLKEGLQQVRDHFQHTGDQARSTGGSQVGHIRDELRHVGDMFRHTSDSVRNTGENLRHTGESQLHQANEQARQAGESLQNPEIHVSIHADGNSKQTQTEKDFQ
ncbi:hypothetical protein PISL3812_06288 [Talaromyces islandicus]|uniref:SMODS and SLOG-associating 2TM effector domain-containing protein n=1 Tax=Talaromyces islandicus TaxID=28573 RepID=A0A0U1M1E8_TALIS|nr:hypothetical protein PISL3812_06288 [Talaromyces islandicus]